jgi:hypothetical protein
VTTSIDLRPMYRAVREAFVVRWKCRGCGRLYRTCRLDRFALMKDVCGCVVQSQLEEIPIDRTPWLVLADALDESGQHDLATAWRWLAHSDRFPTERSSVGRIFDWWKNSERGVACIEFLERYSRSGRPYGWWLHHNSLFHAFCRLAEAIRDQCPAEVYGE